MKRLLPFLLLALLAVTARAADPDDQLPPTPRGKSFSECHTFASEYEAGPSDEYLELFHSILGEINRYCS